MILTAGVTPRSLRIRSFSGPYFPTVRIQSEFRKIRTRKTPNTDTSHTMSFGYLITHLNPFRPSAAFTIKTSHLLCSATRMTSFYMKRNIIDNTDIFIYVSCWKMTPETSKSLQ